MAGFFDSRWLWLGPAVVTPRPSCASFSAHVGLRVGIIETMILPVYVPDWQIGDGEHPHLGMSLSHVLVLETDNHHQELGTAQDQWYGKFGQEVTVTGVAEPLGTPSVYDPDAFPTAIHCEGFSLYWDAPTVTQGPVTLTGIIDASDYGKVPGGFPEVSGVVVSMELAAMFYADVDGDGMNWVPAPGHDQQLRPISNYPRYVPAAGEGISPHLVTTHLVTTGVVLHLDISADINAAGTQTLDATPDESLIRIRLYPDYADTVLWLYGPVSYADARLSPALSADMETWEASYYDSLDSQQSWKHPQTAAPFSATGRKLAHRLADELGVGFEVDFHSYAPRSVRKLFRSEQSSQNPAAAEAFRAMVAAEDELKAQFAADQGNGIGWFAYAPLSGAVFDPGGHYPEHEQNPGLRENPSSREDPETAH